MFKINGLQKVIAEFRYTKQYTFRYTWSLTQPEIFLELDILKFIKMTQFSNGYFFMELVMSFKVGDVVQLKSGGPLMTIESITGESYMDSAKGDLNCVWFDKNKPESKNFNPLTVESAG